MYTEEIVGIAKRENNKKRNYLVVNRLQGKHVPVKPSEAFSMFHELAGKVKKRYEKERLLLIGFAETATAIGAAIAERLDCYYIQTTRELIEEVEYIYFTESHSHATEQKLVKEDIEAILPQIDRIVFIEDEVTTGNTIWKIIEILKKQYDTELKFGVASLLNGMNATDQARYNEADIELIYLVKTNHASYGTIADEYRGDGTYHNLEEKAVNSQVDIHTEDGYLNARRVHKSSEAVAACEKLWKQIAKRNAFVPEENILVLGTEEFMYPALAMARKIEAMGCDVLFHATTRSPIAVSTEEAYPLHTRYELRSLYEKDRVTYIYELKKYDRVVIITDAKEFERNGLFSLTAALEQVGNDRIEVIGWC